MEFVLRELISLVGWVVAAGILFQAWKRSPNRGSRLALIGFLLMLGSALVGAAVLLALNVADISRVTFSIAISLSGFPGLVGTILVIYAFWVIVKWPPPVERIK